MESASQHSSPVASPPTLREPNIFELKGQGISISYYATSISGEPLFHYKDSHRDVRRSGTDIRRVETEIGTLVTVTIQMTVDAGATDFTLLVPRVKMPNTTKEQVSTWGITTHNRTAFLPGPAQLQTYAAVNLSGNAQFVLF